MPSCASHERQSRRPSTPIRPPLLEVLGERLGLSAVHLDVEEVRLVHPVPRLVLLAAVDGQAELEHGGAGRDVPELGVAGQSSDECHAIDVAGHYSSSGASADVVIVADGGADRYWLGRTPLGPTCRQVAHHVVVDLEHARQLVDRLGVRREAEEVVDALLLLLDRVGEPPPAPHVVALEGPAALLDQRAYPVDDLGLFLFGQIGIEQQQDLVFGHSVPSLLPSV